MEMNRREVLRYLGYGGQSPDEQVSALLQECWDELTAAAAPRCLSRSFDLCFFEEDGIDASCFQTHSKSLRKNQIGRAHV